MQSNILKQLVENAKRSHAWVKKSRGPIYKGDTQSTLRNKKTYLRKAALGSKKITDMFPTGEVAKPNTDNDDLTFDDIYDNSNDNGNKFTLESLDSLLKKKKDDLRLRTVSQFLHLVQD